MSCAGLLLFGWPFTGPEADLVNVVLVRKGIWNGDLTKDWLKSWLFAIVNKVSCISKYLEERTWDVPYTEIINTNSCGHFKYSDLTVTQSMHVTKYRMYTINKYKYLDHFLNSKEKNKDKKQLTIWSALLFLTQWTTNPQPLCRLPGFLLPVHQLHLME